MAVRHNELISDLPQMHLIDAVGSQIPIPSAYALLNGDYSRAQDSLVIELPDGTSYFISGYFSLPNPPALIAPNGAVISGDIASQLAGPANPGQYAQTTGADGAKPIGQIVSVEGTVTVQRADGTTATLNNRDFVFENDVVITGANSSAAITFTDDTVLRLSADARMILDEYVYSPQESSGNKAVFNLISGAVGAVSGLIAPSGDMLVTTPSATLAIRGTTVLIEATANETKINLLVDVKDGQGGLVQIVDPANPSVVLQQITVNNIGQVVEVQGGTNAITINQISAADQAVLTSVVSVLTSSFAASQNETLEINNQTDAETDADGEGENTEGQEGEETQQDQEGENSGDNDQTPTDSQDEAPAEEAPAQEGEQQDGSLDPPVENNQGTVEVAVIDEILTEADIVIDDTGSGGGIIDTGAGDGPLDGGSNDPLPPPADPPPANNPPVDAAPVISLPSAPTISEDATGISFSGFSVTDSGGTPVTVSLAAFSTVTIQVTTGLTLISGSFTDAETVSFSGSPTDVTNALNSISYNATEDNDQTGGFAISVSDGTNVTTETFEVPITPVQDPPEVSAGIANQQATEDAAFSFDIPNDAFFDPDTGDTLTYTIDPVGSVPLPTWVQFDGQTISGTPDNDDVGSFDVQVTASDGTDSVSTTFTIEVQNVNDPAVITGDISGSVTEGTDISATGDLDHTDVDNPDDQWSTTVVSQGSFGLLTIASDGQWSYAVDDTNPTVNALASGETLNDTVTVATTDGTQQVISLTINGTNDASVITGDTFGNPTEDSGTPATGDLNHTDVDGPDDQWDTTVVSQGSFGTLTIASDGQWSYTINDSNPSVDALNVDNILNDSVTVQTVDGTQQVIDIEIDGANDPADITGTISGSIAADATGPATGDLDHTDVDDTDDVWDTTVVSQATYGTLTIGVDGQWQYTVNGSDPMVIGLAAGETLTDTATVETDDGTEQVITITINGANEAPTFGGVLTGSVTEDSQTSVSGNADHTDPDGPNDAWQIGSNLPGTYGTLSNTADGQWTYTVDSNNAAVDALNAGATLIDTVNITAADGTPQTITITINGENDAAIITGDVSGAATEDSGTPATGDLNHTDVDNTNDTWNTTVVTQGSFGTLTITAAGVWSYALDNGNATVDALAGGDTLTDTVTVATEDGTQQNIQINITGANDAANVTGDITGSVTEDNATPATGNLDHTDVDNADDVWNTTVDTQGDYGTLTIGTDGQWSYALDNINATVNALASGETLTDFIKVSTTDGTLADIEITINGANDAPTFGGILSGSVTEDSQTSVTGNADHTDPDGPDDAWQIGSNLPGTYGTLSNTTDGQWTYTVDSNNAAVDALNVGATLIDTVNITAADGTQQAITITINGENDAAVISGDVSGAATEDSGTPSTGDLNHTDVDNTNDTWNTTVVTQGSFGTLTITAAGVWSYALDEANATVNGLVGGDTLIDTVIVETEDGTQQNIQININGTNDAPVFSGELSGSVSEDSQQSVTRNADHTDVDGPDDLWQIGSDLSGTYGVLSNTTDGQWTYIVDGDNATVDALNVGQTLTDTINITAADGTQQAITITINGENDASIITGNVSGTGTEDSGTPVTGDLNHADVDNTDDVWDTNVVSQGSFGALTINANGQWSYAINNANATVNALNTINTIVDTVTVQTEDGTQQNISILINGANDAAVITGDVSGTVTEDTGTPATGDLNHTDVDNTDDAWSTTVVTQGSFGTLTIGADGQWSYALDDGNATVDALTSGQTLTDTVTVATSDGTQQTITITINGADDSIVGTNGDDVLNGTPGDDLFEPLQATGAGDLINASAGNDTVIFTNATPGFYTIDYSALGEDISATLLGSTGTIVKGALGTDTLTDFDDIEPVGGGLQIITGAGDDDFLVDPSLSGVLYLKVGTGTDTVLNDANNEFLRVDVSDYQGAILENGFGLNLGGSFDNPDTVEVTGRLNEWFGTDFADWIVGQTGMNNLIGNGGDDVLLGTSHAEQIFTGNDSESDIVVGGGGNDRIFLQGGADIVVHNPGDGNDEINTFTLSQGDRIALGGHNLTTVSGLVTFDGTNTIVTINPTNVLTITGVDLTGAGDAPFIFDQNYIIGTTGDETFSGSSGDEYYLPGDATPDIGDTINVSGGSDTIDFRGIYDGFYRLRYDSLGTNLDIDITGDNGTINKGGGDIDSLLNLGNFRGDSLGFLRIEVGAGNDTIDVDTTDIEFIAFRFNGGGTDTVTHTGTGTLRLEFRNYNGVIIDANAGTATEINGSAVTNIMGPVGVWRASTGNDTITGTNNSEHFITEEGDDTVDGGGTADQDVLRYDRFFFDGFGGTTGINVEFTAQGTGTASGIWYGQSFTDNFQNIEIVRGSQVGVNQFTGSSGNETFVAKGGANIFNASGGTDTFKASGEFNLFVFDGSGGNTTIQGFVIGQDQIVLTPAFGASNTGEFDSFTFTGGNTVITEGTTTITIEGVDLTTATPADVFTFNTITGTSGNDEGASALNGTTGNDVILGLDGNDDLFGGDGNDVLVAGGTVLSFISEGNLLEGGAGNDTLIAEEGFNILRGGAGNDTLVFTATEYVSNFDNFWDWAWADYRTSTSGIIANFSTTTQNGLTFGQVSDGLGGIDTVQGVHVIVDSAHDDTFYVDRAWQNQYGNTWLEVRLSDGDDTVQFDPAINTNNGTARISYQLASDGVFASLATGTASDNNLDNGDQIGSDTFFNANYLRGSNHADHLVGDGNDNFFRGSGGNDLIDGGGGIDQIDHNDSINSVIADLSQNTVYDDGRFGGRDTLISIENIRGGYGDDIISGDNQANSIRGNTGDDVLIGGDGDDNLRGGSGDIFQDSGNLLDGDDILIGGDGSDTMRGGDGADLFVITDGLSTDFDTIQDFNFGDGDRIDMRAVTGVSSITDFTNFNFDGTNTTIQLASGQQIFVQNADLTASGNTNFIFETRTSKIVGTQGDDSISGTSGNDFIAPGDATSSFGDSITGSTGNDIIEFLGTVDGFYSLNYSFGVGSINASLGITGSDTVLKGLAGANGTDTLLNLDMINGNEGGLIIRGSNNDDIFTVNLGNAGLEWLSIRGGADFGDDTINRVGTSGILRVDLRDFEGANVNASTGSVVERFAAGGPTSQATLTVTDNSTGVGFVDEWRGSFFDDIFVGSSGDDRFITESGNDTVDGGGGFDTARYNRSGVGNLSVVYSSPGAAIVAGTWGLAGFIDDLTSIERIMGSNLGVDLFSGSSAGETFEGQGGAGVFEAKGGDDILKASDEADLFIIGAGDGNDTIRNFMVGEDIIDLSGTGFTASANFVGYTFDGQNTIIDLGGGNTITVEDENLTNNTDAEVFILSAINGDDTDNTLNGTAANERFNAFGGNDVVNAGAGNDLLLSGGANLDFNGLDILNGEAGNDVLIAEGGQAILNGGPGNDTLLATHEFGDPDFDFARADYSDSPGAITANLTNSASGNLGAYQINDGHGTIADPYIDTIGAGIAVIVDSNNNDNITIDGSFNNGFAEVRLSEGDDTVTFTNTFGGRRISYKEATDGVDASLVTQSASDRNVASPGIDDIGNDTFTNANQLRGSDFADVLTGDGNDNRLRGSGGDDTIVGGAGIDTIDHFDSPAGITVGLSLGTVSNDGFGNSDTISEIENINGSYFNDGITGDNNANVINGFLGQDNLSGGGGNDTIDGGKGADILNGGSGNDTFVVSTLDGTVDNVTDFNPLEDVFDISAILDDAFAPGSPDTHVEVVVSGSSATVRVDTNDAAGVNFTDIATLGGVTSGTFNFVYDDNDNQASVTIA